MKIAFFSHILYISKRSTESGSSVGSSSAWYSDGRGFEHPVRQEIGHEIISTAIHSLSLIQAGSCQLLAKETALSTGKPLKSKRTQENCG